MKRNIKITNFLEKNPFRASFNNQWKGETHFGISSNIIEEKYIKIIETKE